MLLCALHNKVFYF